MYFGPISDAIKRYREQKQLSQDQLADAVGVSQQAVANWELGKTRPKGTRLEKLYEVLGRQFKEEMELNPELAALSLSPVAKSQQYATWEPPVPTLPGMSLPPRNDPPPPIDPRGLPLRHLEDMVRDALPEQYQKNFGKEVTLAGKKWVADYLSDHVHIEFLHFRQVAQHRTVLTSRIRETAMRMLTIRAIQGDDLGSAIIVVSPDVKAHSMISSTLFFEMALHRIELAFVLDPQGAAGLVIGIEEAGLSGAFADHDEIDPPFMGP